MLNIFIVPSSIQPLFGVIDYEERYRQTLKTIQSIKENVKGEFIIVLADSSAKKLSSEKTQALKDSVNLFLDFYDDEKAQYFNSNWMKSHGENYLLYNSIRAIKDIYLGNYNLELQSIAGRMYKLGGRCALLPSLNIKEHTDEDGKYVFKKRLSTWRNLEQQKVYNSTHLLETRFYSWSLNLVDDYLNIIEKNFELFSHGLDTEHAHLINIPPDKLVEKNKMHVGCYIAASGQYIED